MKTKKLSKNLILRKETVVNLNNSEMSEIQGGATAGLVCKISNVFPSCETCPSCYETAVLYTCGTSVPGAC